MTTATISLPIYNAEQLAKALKEHGLPGQRTKTAITRLRRERSKRRPNVSVPQLTVEGRLNQKLIADYSAEIDRRSGETSIRTDRDRYADLTVADRENGLTLLHVSAWRYYSRSVKPRRASLSYLCGREDGQLWAVRVAGTITTVRDAIDFVTPKAVKDAQARGKRVERQGDVYCVETTKAHDGKGELPENHVWDPEARVLAHPEHGTLHLDFPVRFVPQNAYQMGRGSGRAYGD